MLSVKVPTKAATGIPTLNFLMLDKSFDHAASPVEKINATTTAIMCKNG